MGIADIRTPPLGLRRSLRVFDGLAMVVGIMVGSGIFRTPGLVAHELGRPWLTFVAWVLGGALALLGALIFAELATRYPKAGGKYVYAREAFGPRAGFVVGWVEGLAIYTAAIAGLGVVTGEFVGRLTGWSPDVTRWIGVGTVALFIGINLVGVASGRWVQNVVTAAKVLALGGVVSMALAGTGTFTQLIALAIVLILVIDGLTVAALFRLRARQPHAPFRVPLYPLVPALFIAVYAALLVGTALAQAKLVCIGAGVLAATWGLSWTVRPASAA